MKKIFTVLILGFSAYSLLAQGHVVSNQSVIVNIIGAIYQYEAPVGQQMTVLGSAGLVSPILLWSNGDFNFAMAPVIGVEPRYYYNLKRRAAENKVTTLNAANFVSTEVQYIFKSIIYRNVRSSSGLLVAPMWGMRRIFNNRWFLETSGGLNIFFRNDTGTVVSPRVNLMAGLVF